MPTQPEHLYKAKNNKLCADKMSRDNPTSVGWVLTVLFYSALHYVEAYNAKFNTHFSQHADRNEDMGKNPVLKPIFSNYQELSTYSWNARYKPCGYGEKEIQEAIESHAAVAKLICTSLGIRP
jgi:hypothetical protein